MTSTRYKHDLVLLVYSAIVTACLGLLLTSSSRTVNLRFSDASLPQRVNSEARIKPELRFIQLSGGPPSVHAGTITRLHDGQLLAAWFAGTREGARDVRIVMSRLVPGSTDWSEPTVIATREQTAEDLERHIAKLGNPILYADSRRRLWLFYVTVSMGGWSGSSITMKHSDDDGATWGKAKRLVTSPFLNISTLVKGCPIECESGELLLPVYHEFIRKFSEAVIISPQGDLVSKVRITAERGAIQPWIVPVDREASIAFYRQSGHNRKLVLTNKLGNLFQSDVGSIGFANIPNPDAGIAVVRRTNGDYLMACNPLVSGRNRLALATSRDGLSWKIIRDIEVSDPPEEYSYPYLIQSAPGEYHLVYTWNRTKMRYLAFDEHWLESTP